MLMAILLVSGAVAGQGDRGATLLADDTTFEVVATVAVPDAPHGICFSADGRFAYVACEGNHTVSVIRTTTAPGPTPGPANTEVVGRGLVDSGRPPHPPAGLRALRPRRDVRGRAGRSAPALRRRSDGRWPGSPAL